MYSRGLKEKMKTANTRPPFLVWEGFNTPRQSGLSVRPYLNNHTPVLRRGWLIAVLFFFLANSLFSMNLDETLRALKLPSASGSPEFIWDPFFHDGTFSYGSHFGTFSAARKEGESGFLMIDSREIFTVPLPYHENGALVFPDVFVGTLKNAFIRSFENDSSRFRIISIIIDPGHGGKDPGAIGNLQHNGRPLTAVEKDIVLNVALRLKPMLERAFPDKRIIMTRETDVYLSLEQRVDIANSVFIKDNEAVIYISIHANYVFNASARGYEVWYLSPEYRRNLLGSSRSSNSSSINAIRNAMLEEEFTTESVILAQSILRNLGEALGPSVPSRGLKDEEWFVVRNSRMPAVLVELGFVSNLQDALIMTGQDGLQKLTDALYKGIIDFVGVFERSGGFTAAP
jgi:N-acetylmuramoyl-L-alanine amidase